MMRSFAGWPILALFLLAFVGSTPDRAPVGERDYSAHVAGLMALAVAPDSVPVLPSITGPGAYAMTKCYAYARKYMALTTAGNGTAGSIDSIINNIPLASAGDTFTIVTGYTLSGGNVHTHNSNHVVEDVECVWLAGNTAQGGTFVLESDGNESFVRFEDSDNIVFMGWTLRFTGSANGGGGNLIKLYDVQEVVIAYNSFHFADDQALTYSSGVDTIDDVSKDIQWYRNVFTSTNTGATFQAAADQAALIGRVKWAQNVFLANQRGPLCNDAPEGCIIEENLTYDFASGQPAITLKADTLADGTAAGKHRVVGNHMLPGPSSGAASGLNANPLISMRIEQGSASHPEAFIDRNFSDSAMSIADTGTAAVQDSLCRKTEDESGLCDGVDLIDDFVVPAKFTNARQWPAAMLLDSLLLVFGNVNGWSCNADSVARRDATDDSLKVRIDDRRAISTLDSIQDLISTGYPTPTAGTACTVTGNIAPDSVEVTFFGVADTVTLTADHNDSGRPTDVAMLLLGLDPTGAGGGGTTYPSGRDVYLLPWVTEQVIRGADTDSVRIPDPDSFNVRTTRGLYYDAPPHDSAYVITCGSPPASGNVTEAVADSVHTDWALPQDPDTVTVGGC